MENSVNAGQQSVVETAQTQVSAENSEVVSGTEGAPAAAHTESPGQAPAEKHTQTRAENAAFRQMRQELEKAKSERSAIDSALARARSAMHLPDSVNADDIADSIVASTTGEDVSLVRSRRIEQAAANAQAFQAAKESDPEYIKLRQEIAQYKRQAFQAQQEKDLNEIKAKFPGEKAKSIDDLGDQFFRLRAAGVDNLTAYAAISTARQASVTPTPPDTGAVGTSAEQEPEFFTPEQVDKLTTKQLDDPKIMEKVMKSMTKWKK